jgi:PAT family beta-lactamase induction signal transducer AmpG
MLPLGFVSGLPLALIGGTLQAWLTVAGVDLQSIGLFSLVGLPYALKFLWAPLMDRFHLPWLGRRRGWLLTTQLSLVAGILVLASMDPARFLLPVAAVALVVAFLSASQDIVADAYRADVLKPEERGIGAGLSVAGYRLALLVSGAGALILAERLGWQKTYLLMAGCLVVGAAATLAAPEPAPPATLPSSVWTAIRGPVEALLSQPEAFGILALVALYKLGDTAIASFTSAFLIRGLQFGPADVGLVYKGVGLVATMVGGVIGGMLLGRLGLPCAMLVFGWLQACSNLLFMMLAEVGHNWPVMVGVVTIENLCGGMGTAAMVTFMMAVCDPRYTATQFALLSALASAGRVFSGVPAGYVVEALGWTAFYFFTFLASLPGLWILWHLRHRLPRA